MTDSVFSLPTGNHFSATLQFVDAKGNVGVAPEGVVPSWVVDETSLLTLTVASDGMSADISAVGPTGVATVTVTDGSLTGTLAVTIEAGVITSITVVPGSVSPNA